MSIDNIIKQLQDFPQEHQKKLIAKIKECYCEEHQQYADVIDVSADFLNFKASCCCPDLEAKVRAVKV